ncbi:HNH endonuclease [Stenotrophomonas bentonitica]|uniref:HNH endonuclease n=1 Tax=Stenotrophomonas bentonitica TaxID=1450134 RepID=UPI0031BA3BA7
MTQITQQKVREFLSYEPDTGLFRYRKGKRAGKVAGHQHHGYVKISLPSHGGIYAHRLAWLYMTGALPIKHVDHIDCERNNNAWANLRLARPDQNQANTRRTKRNISGAKGVFQHRGCFRAVIQVKGRRIYLGDYNTLQEAAAAYAGAARVGFGEFARVA